MAVLYRRPGKKSTLNFAHLDTPLPLPPDPGHRAAPSAILAEVLGALGVPVERPVALTGLSQDAEGVTSTPAPPRWAVRRPAARPT